MQSRGLRDPADGRLVAVTGLFENGRTRTQPIIGYDTTRLMEEVLTRIGIPLLQRFEL